VRNTGKLTTVTRGLWAASLLFVAPAGAQDYNIYEPLVPAMPRTVPLNDKDGNVIGTVTFSGNRMFLRNAKGELTAQIIVDADGTQRMLDPHGKVLDQLDR